MSRVCAANIRRMIKEGVMCRLKSSGRLVRKPLIEPMTKKRLNEPFEGSVVDLSVQTIYVPKLAARDPEEARKIMASGDVSKIIALCCPSLLGPTMRQLSDVQPLPWLSLEGEIGCFLPPGVYLLESRETVNLPDTLAGPLKSRSSIFRSFASLHVSEALVGYQGKIVGLLVVHHPIGFTLLRYARFAYIAFETFDTDNPNDTDAYCGIYGTEGFKVTTEGQTVRPY